MKLRTESYFYFIKKSQLNFLFGLSLAFSLLLSIGIFSLELKNKSNSFYFIIPIVAVFLFFIILLTNSFINYKKGYKLAQFIEEEIVEIKIDCHIEVVNFNFFERSNKFSPYNNITLYNFDKCDIIVASSSFFILGKGINGMIYNYATPLEIVINGEAISSNSAFLKEVSFVKDEFIHLTIDDYNYENPLKIKIEATDKLLSSVNQFKKD